MHYYPIKKEFYSIFLGKEIVLQELIERNSKQLEGICEYINIYDFYRRCIRFYGEDHYRLIGNAIVYTHPITKQESKCFIHTHYFVLSNLMGFEKWLQRYFTYYFCTSENNGSWFTFLRGDASNVGN